jgi:transposase
LKEYVRWVRPAPPADPVVRFETPPGQQAQVDFAEFHLPWGKRYALLVVLGYSRLLWLQFYARQTMAVLMGGLKQAFGSFSGVPAELLFDQMKSVIIDDERASGGRLLENARVRALRRALRLSHTRLQTLPSQDQGQGGTADQLRAPELLLRSALPQRR